MYAASSSPLFQPTINRKSKKVASALTPLVERQFEEQSRKKERLHQLTERVEREQQAEATFSPRLSKAPPYLDLAGRVPLSERPLPSRPSEPPLDPEATFRPKTNHHSIPASSERRSFSSSPQHSWGEERMSSSPPSLSSSSALLDSQAKRQARELWREFADGPSMSVRGILSVLKTFGITEESRPDLIDKFLMAMDVDEGDEAKRYVPYDRFLKVMTTVVRAAMVDGTTKKVEGSNGNTNTNGVVRKIIQPKASSVQQPSSSQQVLSSSYKSPSVPVSDRSDRATQATNVPHKRALSEQSHRHMNITGPTARPTSAGASSPYANKSNNGKATSGKGFHHIGVVDSDSEVNDASSDQESQESLPVEGRRGPPPSFGVEYFLSSPSQHRKAQASRDNRTQRESSSSPPHLAKKRASSSLSVSNDDSGDDAMSGARVLASDFSPLPQNPTRALGPTRASSLSSFAERERSMKQRGQGAVDGGKSRPLASPNIHLDPHDTNYGDEGDDVGGDVSSTHRPRSSSQKREKVSLSTSPSSAAASSPHANKAHGHTHRPMINPLSYSASIAQRREAEGGLAGRSKMSEKAIARQVQLAAEREEKEKALCSFRPQTLGGIDPRVSALLKAAKERRESRGPSGGVSAKRSSSEVRNPPSKRSASSMRGQGDRSRAAPTRSSQSLGGGKRTTTSQHQEDHFFDEHEEYGISPSPKQHNNDAEVSRSRSVSTSVGSAMGRSDRVIVQMPKDPPGFDKVIRRLAEGRARAVPKFEDALRSAAGAGSSLTDSKGEVGGPTEPKPFVLASEARQQERAQRKPLLFVDVNLPHGKSGRIGVYNGDDPATLAHNFCVTYGLDTDALEQLTVMLQQRIDITLRANAIRKVWA